MAAAAGVPAPSVPAASTVPAAAPADADGQDDDMQVVGKQPAGAEQRRHPHLSPASACTRSEWSRKLEDAKYVRDFAMLIAWHYTDFIVVDRAQFRGLLSSPDRL